MTTITEQPKLKHTSTTLTPIDMEDKSWMFQTRFDYSRDSARLDVTKWIEQDTDDKFSVLDVGCASGKTLKHLRDIYPYAKLFGIEPDSIVSKAREVCEVFNCNVEEFVFDMENGKYSLTDYFDYILMSDVVEHLHDPWIVLKDIKKFLKPNGTLLASIPNVGFITVIMQLLGGRFYYGSEGIINKEHLRYFTLHEIIEMFDECGYKDISYAINTIEILPEIQEQIELLEKTFGKSRWQSYDAYQYVVKGKK